jgi:hypothetical protein
MSIKSHGHTTHTSSSPTYKSWHTMMQRCGNPNNPQFKDYGERGITVCERWKVFKNFLTDMGVRPEGLTLDRKDNSKGYTPDNCKWSTKQEQQRNTRSNNVWELDGQRKTVAEWADQLGMKRHSLYMRVASYGWTVRRALTTAPMLRGRRKKGIESDQ